MIYGASDRKNNIIIYCILLSFLFLSSCHKVDNNGLALTPPMGWNSWNAFQGEINEDKIKEAADILVTSGMRDAGYTYLVIDDGWMAKERDRAGNLVGDSVKFPHGMKALGDYIHHKGLKFGIYECRGVLTCMKLPGSFNHEEQDMKTFASWGVDYIKLDGCYAERNGRLSSVELALYRRSILKTGRPMILSISDFGNGSWAWGAKESAQLWRTSYDIYPDMESVYYCAETSGGSESIHPAFNGLWQFAGPGHWNDADMLQVGNLPDITDNKTHFSLWCILASPLMAGNDLSKMSAPILNILTAPEVIAVNQDARGFQGYKVYNEDSHDIYCKPLSDGTAAVLMLNKGKKPTSLTVTWEMIGLAGKQKVRDLWERKELGVFNDSFNSGNLAANGSMLIKVGTPGGRLVSGPSPVPYEKYSVTGAGTTWLSELYYVMKSGDAPRYDGNYNGETISVNGIKYHKGLGCRSSSRIMFRLNGRADRFMAVIGPDDSYRGKESSRFRVLNEDFFGNQILYDSGLLKPGSSVNIDINVKGVQYLLLMYEGDNTFGVWADARVSGQKI